SKAELAEKLELPAHEQRGPNAGIVEGADDVEGRGIKLGMRVALRQEPRQSRQGADGGECRGIIEDARGVGLQKLDIEAAEMFRQPRPPGDAEQIARLEQRPHAARAPSAHQSEMTAMAEREELSDGIRLAQRLGGEEDALVGPIHLAVLDRSEVRLKPSRQNRW